MLTEFESRLADVLGSRIPAPFQGRVARRGATAPAGAGPVIRVGVKSLEFLAPDVGSLRREVVPGSVNHRRVLRLGVTVGIDVTPTNEGDRLQQLLGTDMLAYELDHPEIRSASVLAAPGDQGFLIESLQLVDGQLRGDSTEAAGINVRAEGWFWPVGETGQTGVEIDRVLLREFRLPVHLEVGATLEAGGSPVRLRIGFGATGTLVVEDGAVSRAPFGSVTVRVINAGGGAGAGSLSGGANGPGGTRLIDVDAGTASVDYAPPPGPVVDILVVTALSSDAEGNLRAGVELARFDLVVG